LLRRRQISKNPKTSKLNKKAAVLRNAQAAALKYDKERIPGNILTLKQIYPPAMLIKR
jgi:hypothetical protein